MRSMYTYKMSDTRLILVILYCTPLLQATYVRDMGSYHMRRTLRYCAFTSPIQ